MPYAPGPLVLQQPAEVGVVTSFYNFAADVYDQLGELDTIPAGWDGFLSDAGALMSEPSDPCPDIDIDGAIHVMGAYADPASVLGVDDLVTGIGTADLNLSTAIGYAPAEAWFDASTPFTAPAPAEIVAVPVIPPGSISIGVTGVVSGPTLGGGTGTPLQSAGATLTNITRFAQNTFYVGDQYQIVATGGYGQPVYLYGTFNGNELGGGLIGSIGFDGTFSQTGQMDYTSVGIWEETVFVGSVQVASFSFIVLNS